MIGFLAASAAGVALLAFAPARFVAGAAALANRLGLSRVMVGAGGIAAGGGDVDFAAGNVVGSNIANLSLILGVAGLVCTLGVPRGLVRRELPLMAVATVAFAVAVQGGISRIEGLALALGLASALLLIISGASRRELADALLASDVGEYIEPELAAGVRREVLDATRIGPVALVAPPAGVAGTVDGAPAADRGSRAIPAPGSRSGRRTRRPWRILFGRASARRPSRRSDRCSPARPSRRLGSRLLSHSRGVSVHPAESTMARASSVMNSPVLVSRHSTARTTTSLPLLAVWMRVAKASGTNVTGRPPGVQRSAASAIGTYETLVDRFAFTLMGARTGS